MYFGLVLPPSGLKFTFVGFFFKYLFASMITSVFIGFYLSHSCVCGARGICERELALLHCDWRRREIF